jgi:hypothetical protein
LINAVFIVCDVKVVKKRIAKQKVFRSFIIVLLDCLSKNMIVLQKEKGFKPIKI